MTSSQCKQIVFFGKNNPGPKDQVFSAKKKNEPTRTN